jgi:hypothetical protein
MLLCHVSHGPSWLDFPLKSSVVFLDGAVMDSSSFAYGLRQEGNPAHGKLAQSHR